MADQRHRDAARRPWVGVLLGAVALTSLVWGAIASQGSTNPLYTLFAVPWALFWGWVAFILPESTEEYMRRQFSTPADQKKKGPACDN